MAHVMIFVAPVPSTNREAYLEHSRKAAAIFKDLGATEIVECWGSDVPDGELTSLPMAVKLEEGETVVMGWIHWPSKEVRDASMDKAMQDPRMQEIFSNMPLDGKRLIFGGFETILEACCCGRGLQRSRSRIDDRSDPKWLTSETTL